ncbi:MAG: hypothetical protein ABWY19_13025 [Marmoricola sp.]
MRTMYVAVVEVATRGEIDLEDAMTLLADYRPAITTSSRGWVEVQISFMATGLAHACTKAAAVARAATGAESIACTVMTEHEHIARRGLEPGVVGGRHAASGQQQQWALPRQPTASEAT